MPILLTHCFIIMILGPVVSHVPTSSHPVQPGIISRNSVNLHRQFMQPLLRLRTAHQSRYNAEAGVAWAPNHRITFKIIGIYGTRAPGICSCFYMEGAPSGPVRDNTIYRPSFSVLALPSGPARDNTLMRSEEYRKGSTRSSPG